jgi:hypothetical protein
MEHVLRPKCCEILAATYNHRHKYRTWEENMTTLINQSTEGAEFDWVSECQKGL